MVVSSIGSHLAVMVLALYVAPVSAFWRLPCKAPLVVQRADPIMNPGEPSEHAHTIMGANGFGFDMTYEDTQASTCSSCSVKQDLSNYWVPKLYYKAQNGTFIDVPQDGGALIYYLQRTDPKDPEFAKGLLAYPEGFRMLAGNPYLRSYNGSLEQQAISYACLGVDGPETHAFPPQNCPNGVRSQVFFPSCWDGVNLDSPDHKSHMAYPSGYNSGFCPPSHPKRFISIFYEVLWKTQDFVGMWYDGHQPFVWAFGDDTGYGYHGDFLNGWHVPTLQRAINECTDDSGVIEKCNVFEFFTDEVCYGCKIPASIDESITGLLENLPGCNPVQSGPGLAKAVSGCGAPTRIGAPENYFVDLTLSKGFEYVGCGLDNIDFTKTLEGPDFRSDDLSNEKCVDFCTSKGFSIAGTEYSRECYCGNSIRADRGPVPNLMGDCFMPCSGDNKEFCGGKNQISLYRKCGSTCQNVLYLLNNKTSSTNASGGYVYPTYIPSGVVGPSSAAGYPAPSSGGNWSAPSLRPTISLSPVASSASSITYGASFEGAYSPTRAGASAPSSVHVVDDGDEDFECNDKTSSAPARGASASKTPQPVIVTQTKTVIPLSTIPAPKPSIKSSGFITVINRTTTKRSKTHTVAVATIIVTVTCKTSSAQAPVVATSSKAKDKPKVQHSTLFPLIGPEASSTEAPAAPLSSSSAPYAICNGTSKYHYTSGRHSHVQAHATSRRRFHR